MKDTNAVFLIRCMDKKDSSPESPTSSTNSD